MPSICEQHGLLLAAEALAHERQAEQTVPFTALLDRRAIAALMCCAIFNL